MDFGHPQVPLALIVGERDGIIREEAQDVFAVVFEALDEVVDRRLGDSPALSLGSWLWFVGVFGFCFRDDPGVALLPAPSGCGLSEELEKN